MPWPTSRWQTTTIRCQAKGPCVYPNPLIRYPVPALRCPELLGCVSTGHAMVTRSRDAVGLRLTCGSSGARPEA